MSMYSNGGRIDLVASDAILVLLLLKIRSPIQAISPLLLLCILFFIYCSSLAFVATVVTSDPLRLGSCIKFLKPYIFLIVGLLISQRLRFLRFADHLVIAILVLTWNLLGSTIITRGFPSIRWGGKFWGFDVYGFPNSSAVFLAALTPFLLTSLLTKKGFQKALVTISYFALSILAILSFSRSTLLCLISANTLTLWLIIPLMKSSKSFITSGIGILLIVFTAVFFVPQNIFDAAQYGWEGRYRRTFKHSDVSSGRFELWGDAISLIKEHPFIGYSFEPFNDVSQIAHGGTHNQYIEVLWKTGAIGLILFLCLWLLVFRRLWIQASDGRVSKLDKLYRIGTFSSLVGIFISNITQPNLTYSITGNFFCFACGFLCSRKEDICSFSHSGPIFKKIKPKI